MAYIYVLFLRYTKAILSKPYIWIIVFFDNINVFILNVSTTITFGLTYLILGFLDWLCDTVQENFGIEFFPAKFLAINLRTSLAIYNDVVKEYYYTHQHNKDLSYGYSVDYIQMKQLSTDLPFYFYWYDIAIYIFVWVVALIFFMLWFHRFNKRFRYIYSKSDYLLWANFVGMLIMNNYLFPYLLLRINNPLFFKVFLSIFFSTSLFCAFFFFMFFFLFYSWKFNSNGKESKAKFKRFGRILISRYFYEFNCFFSWHLFSCFICIYFPTNCVEIMYFWLFSNLFRLYLVFYLSHKDYHHEDDFFEKHNEYPTPDLYYNLIYNTYILFYNDISEEYYQFIAKECIDEIVIKYKYTKKDDINLLLNTRHVNEYHERLNRKLIREFTDRLFAESVHEFDDWVE